MAQRVSIRTLRPMVQPNSASACRTGRARAEEPRAGLALSGGEGGREGALGVLRLTALLRRRLHRQVGRLFALEDAVNDSRRPADTARTARGHKKPGRRRRRRVSDRRRREACAMLASARINARCSTAEAFPATITPPFGALAKTPSRALDLGHVTDIDRPHLHAESWCHGLNWRRIGQVREGDWDTAALRLWSRAARSP